MANATSALWMTFRLIAIWCGCGPPVACGSGLFLLSSGKYGMVEERMHHCVQVRSLSDREEQSTNNNENPLQVCTHKSSSTEA